MATGSPSLRAEGNAFQLCMLLAAAFLWQKLVSEAYAVGVGKSMDSFDLRITCRVNSTEVDSINCNVLAMRFHARFYVWSSVC